MFSVLLGTFQIIVFSIQFEMCKQCKKILHFVIKSIPVQKVKFSIKEIISKCDQIRSFLQLHGRED